MTNPSSVRAGKAVNTCYLAEVSIHKVLSGGGGHSGILDHRCHFWMVRSKKILSITTTQVQLL